jgi:hypothetical protein
LRRVEIFPCGAFCLVAGLRDMIPHFKLYIAIPVYGQVPVEFMQSMMRLQNDLPCDCQIKFLPGDSLIPRARNSITAAFLKSDCTHLLFIDSDLIFSSDHIRRLMAHEKDVIGGFYPKKKEGPIEWVCNAKRGKLHPDKNALQEVRFIGTGFLMIARTVLEQMIAKHGAQIAYSPDHAPKETEWDLWPVGVHRDAKGFARYLSEDWFFCQRWIDMGGKVYGDARVILKHIGQATYPLKSQEHELLAPKNLSKVSSDHAAPAAQPEPARSIRPKKSLVKT